MNHNLRILVSGATATVARLAATPELACNLGVLLTPHDGQSMDSVLATGLPWACDNAAYSNWCGEAFRKLLHKSAGHERCLWVAAPDVVGDHEATVERFHKWLPTIRSVAGQPVAFVGQDGCDEDSVPWDEIAAYFVGGTTSWKLSPESSLLMRAAARRGKHVHVGRVNSHDRLQWAFERGAHSIDGTSFSRYADTYIERAIRKLQGWEAQRMLFA